MSDKLYINDFIKNEFLFDIVKAGITSDYPVHTHDFFELVIIVGGKATYIINGDAYPITCGDVFGVNPNCSHGYSNVEDISIFNIIFNPESILINNSDLRELPGFQALFILEPYFRKEHQFKSKLELSQEKLKIVQNYLNTILDEYRLKKPGYKTIIQAYFSSLLVFLSREYQSNDSFFTERLLQIADAIIYLEQNYKEEISLKELASMAFMSVRQFIRVFKKNYNSTPIEYLINLRLNYSCKQLKQSDLSISKIAFESGFSDTNYFSRIFKKKYKIAPSLYRKKNQNT
jgi:AraC-like DNA-binding protein